MSKLKWKAGTMIYPLPAVMVSCGDFENSNIITVAWTGTICTNPAMTYISIRPERHSYEMIKNKGEFVINLTTKDLAQLESSKVSYKQEVLEEIKKEMKIIADEKEKLEEEIERIKKELKNLEKI